MYKYKKGCFTMLKSKLVINEVLFFVVFGVIYAFCGSVIYDYLNRVAAEILSLDSIRFLYS